MHGKSKGKGKAKDTNKDAKQKFAGTCHNCGKVGHKSRDCWSAPTQQQQAKGKGKGKQQQKGKSVAALENEQQQQPAGDTGGEIGGLELDLCTLAAGAGAQYGDDTFEATVDSGAAVSVIPQEWFHNYPLRPSAASELGVTYRTASGEQ
eukprot:5073383-Amphidinium_carterae.1